MEIKVIKANPKYADGKTEINDRLRVAAYCRVSTDSEDQEKSYKSMVQYYDEMIDKNPQWHKVGIYADKGFTGTKASNRTEFQRMINDCLAGEIDLILTKSLSRFARNTLDALKYVRLLKENNIGIIFEAENINTLKDGEFLMTILSSVAQQEVENTSANVKKGLKMKMQRGVMVGFSRCEGYRYDKNTKEIYIIEEEAEIVRYIFDRYVGGAGSAMIARELNEKGLKTWKGKNFSDCTVLEIIKNEKYIGDVKMGKTFTTDPISKRRIENKGEEDMYYITNHHPPIVTREQYEKAQVLRKRRNAWNANVRPDTREKYSRKYDFSCIMYCGFCGKLLSRRAWYSGKEHQRMWIWQCTNYIENGKSACPDSKGIHDDVIKAAFVESYNMLQKDNKSVFPEVLKRIETAIKNNSCEKTLENLRREEEEVKRKRKFLLEKYTDGIITDDVYKESDASYTKELKRIQKKIRDVRPQASEEKQLRERIKEIEMSISKGSILEEFDRQVFESLVEKVIIGGYKDDGVKDPYKITFIYKSGPSDTIDDSKKWFKNYIKQKNHSVSKNNLDKNCSESDNDTCGDGRVD